LVLYVVKGRGHTLMNGERVDWKAGDLLLIPVEPGGVEHQHFNEDPDEPAEWIGFIFRPMQDAIGSLVEQVEEAPASNTAR
jgi:gentisate 1,2-dioxygenase